MAGCIYANLSASGNTLDSRTKWIKVVCFANECKWERLEQGRALWLWVKLPFGHGEKSTLEPLIGGDSKKSGRAPLSSQWGRRMSVRLEHSGRMTGRISVRERLRCSCGDGPWGHSPLTVVLCWWFCNANGLMYARSLSEMVIRKGICLKGFLLSISFSF